METTERFQDPRFFAKQPWLEYVFIFSALMAQILMQAGSNYTLPLLKILTDHYHATDGERSWFMSSFSLAAGTFILVSGRLGDVYGLKKVMLWGYVWAIIWSLLAGFAYYVHTPVFFIIARAFQGLGCAFILPNAIGAAGRIYKPGTRRKHMVFSLIGLAAPIGGCIAPIFAGLIAVKSKYWNWICYSFAIAATLGLALTAWSTPHFESQRKTQSVDWIGCGLGVSGLVLFNFVWNQAPGIKQGWKEPYIIVLLIISVLILAVFVWYELKFPSNPLIPKEVIKNIRILLTMLCLFLCWGSFGILFYRFFVFLLYFRNYTPLAAGAGLTPALIFGPIAAVSTGISMKYISVYILLVFAMCPFIAVDIMLALMHVKEVYWRSSMALWILGVFGMDISFPTGSVILSDGLPPQLQGLSGSLLTTMINYGISFALGVDGTVEQQFTQRYPNDPLKVHKACMWLATGFSGGALFSALILATIHFSHRKCPNESDGKDQSALEQNLWTGGDEAGSDIKKDEDRYVNNSVLPSGSPESAH